MLLVWCDSLHEQGIVTSDLLGGAIEPSNLIAEHDPMVLVDEDIEGEPQIGQLFPQTGTRHLDDIVETNVACSQRADHVHPGLSENVAGHGAELDSCHFEQLENAILLAVFLTG